MGESFIRHLNKFFIISTNLIPTPYKLGIIYALIFQFLAGIMRRRSIRNLYVSINLRGIIRHKDSVIPPSDLNIKKTGLVKLGEHQFSTFSFDFDTKNGEKIEIKKMEKLK